MKKLPLRLKLLFSTGDLSTSIPLAILMFFQLYFMTDVAGLRPDLAGWAVGLGKLWDAFNDPLIGLISDRIRTRWGRRRGLLLFFAVPLGLSFMLMWIVPPLSPLAKLKAPVRLRTRSRMPRRPKDLGLAGSTSEMPRPLSRISRILPRNGTAS